MSENHSFLALDWVKGEIEETLKQARQALEAHVENPEDAAQMRFCLAYLHQVHGTLQIVEFYGAALLAEEMEKLCQALINGQVARIAEGQEVLMRAILQLPPYLDRVKQSRRDLPVVLLPLMNDMRATRGESLLSETALFTPDLDAGERAPIQVAPAAAVDVGRLKKIRQAYQLALLGFIRNDDLAASLKKMGQVFARLESMAGAAPIRELWQVGGAIIEGLQQQTVAASTSIKMLLGQVDRQLRLAIDDSAIRAPTELLKNLLYYVAKSGGATPRLQAVKELYRLDESLPGEAMVNEERARMTGPDRDAMKSVVDALCEELARVKDALDLFVRKSDAEKDVAELTAQVPVLKQVADTVAVLGLGQPRRILQEQIDVIDRIGADGGIPQDGALLDIAGALLYVEATLTGMVAEKPIGQQKGQASEFFANDQLNEAQSAVLRESRSTLEKAKDAIIEYIASQWNPANLQSIPALIDTVRGSLFILQLTRPADILAGAGRYVSERLLAGQHRPDWQEMDTLADVITSVEYYLERIANDTHGGDNILDIAERGLGKLGFGKDGAPAQGAATENPTEPARGTESEWQVADEASLEAAMAEAVAPPVQDLPVEMHEDEVLRADRDETVIRPVPDELKEMQERLRVGNFGDVALDDENAELITVDFDAATPLEAAAADDLEAEDWLVQEAANRDDGAAELGEIEDLTLEDLEAAAAAEAEDFPELSPADDTGASTEPLLELEPLAAVTPPKKPILPVLTLMPEDNHDFDEEIREIFAEEAQEVLQNINEYFPRWAANFEDTASLLEFRRGFHTLKGSGRMVGARVVGELAWAFENMLNKVRDKILEPDQVMVNLVSEALAIIPGLVEDFARRQRPRVDTSPLMAAAEAIARGEKLSAMDVANAAAQAQDSDEPESETAVEDFDALVASLAAGDIAAAAAETVAPGAEAAPEPEEEIDPMLLEIFSGEAEMHLEIIGQYLQAIDPERSACGISDEVLRALHTLKGSAGMAGIRPVAELAAPLEHLFKDLRNQVGHARREHLQVLRDGRALIQDAIADLNQGGRGRLAGLQELIARIRQLDQERLAHLEKEQSEKLGPDALEIKAATQGLVAGFMELGLDHVLDAPWELEGWMCAPEAPHHVDVLQQELSRLLQAARQKDVAPLALLCERLVSVYARITAQEIGAEGEILNDLAGAHEEIVDIFDTLAASQTVQPNEAVLGRLLDLLEMPAALPAPAFSDEPGVAAFEPDVQQSLGELVIEGDAPGWVEPAAMTSTENVDPELLEIFLEEADEVLDAAQTELDNWRHDNSNTPALAALQRHLHTLKGGARLAEIRPLGDLAHELEFLYEGLVDGRYAALPELVNLLLRCHDRLADMVGELRASGRCPSGIELVNVINAFRRGPATGDTAAAETLVAPAAPEQFAAMEAVEAAAAAEELPAATDFGAELAAADAAFAGDAAAPEDIPAEVPAEISPPEAAAADANDALFAEFFPGATPAPVAAAPAPPVPAAAPPPSQDFDPELLEIFLEEAGEIVDASSLQLAEWQANPDNTQPVHQLQRGLHTLKGGARMAEIGALGDLAHHLENLYEGNTQGLMTPTPTLFVLLHRCHDRLAEAVESLCAGKGCPDGSDLIAQIKAYIADPEHFQDTPTAVTLKPVEAAAEPAAPAEPPAPRAIDAAPVPENVDTDILEIFLEESEELGEGIEAALSEWLENREASAPLEALMRHLHTLKGGARLAGLKGLGDLAHDWETDLVGIQNGSRQADAAFFNGLNERLEALLAGIKGVGERLKTAPAPAPAAAPKAAGVAPFAAPVTAAAAPAPQRALAPRGSQPPSMHGGFRKDTAQRGPQEMIRVPSDLLEKLVNLAGETSITRSRVEMGVHGFAQTVEEMGATISRLAEQLRRMDSEMETQIVARHGDESGKYEDFDPLEMDQYSSLNQLSKSLAESASDLLDLKSTLLDKAKDTETLLLQQARINTELQEGLMRSRMVPFSRLVPRLKRIVRQTGQEVGKPADLDVINAEGEMDRTLLERIVAPLEHMLRNSVDHGMEDPAGRAAAGKPAQGRVALTLAREGGEVVLTLADDGRGINIPAVRKKAVERGLITEGQEISDQDVIQFIFHAGFSTAAKVTQVSGRGVGMDVVQSEIKQMGGAVSIRSETGQGTTFTIRLPFTVAVSRALMVRVGEDSYAIPLAQIEGIVRASPYELETYYGPDAPLFEYAGVTYRLNYLGEFVHGVKSPNLVGQAMPLPVLLIRGGEQRIAIQVDQLIGSREIVVKSIGSQLASVAGLSGATILGDGSVVIILDVLAMLRAAAVVLPQISVGGTAALAAPEVQRTRQVMVVDDSVTVRKVTSRLLERHGYEVLLAKDGMDAIAKLEDARPDIMLLDIEMPRMDGFEVATLVRHNPHLEDLPIIMITSRTGEKHRERAFQIGVNCYMGKPFQEEQLLETIAELLAAAVK